MGVNRVIYDFFYNRILPTYDILRTEFCRFMIFLRIEFCRLRPTTDRLGGYVHPSHPPIGAPLHAKIFTSLTQGLRQI